MSDPGPSWPSCLEMFLRWPSIKFLQAILSCLKTCPPGGGAILPYMAIMKSSPPKAFGQFSNNFVEMFLWWPSIRFLQAMLIGQKIWPPGGGAVWRFLPKAIGSGAILGFLGLLFLVCFQSCLLQICCLWVIVKLILPTFQYMQNCTAIWGDYILGIKWRVSIL